MVSFHDIVCVPLLQDESCAPVTAEEAARWSPDDVRAYVVNVIGLPDSVATNLVRAGVLGSNMMRCRCNVVFACFSFSKSQGVAH